jgi:hypothetical protein
MINNDRQNRTVQAIEQGKRRAMKRAHSNMAIKFTQHLLSIASATIHEGKGFSCKMLQLPSDQASL